MTLTQSDTPEVDDALSEVMDLVEQWPIIDDLTKRDQREYIKALAALDAYIKRSRAIVSASAASEELVTLMAGLIFYAHNIGTYKTPAGSSPQKGIVSALLTPRTKRPTAEYVDWLEKLDPDFRNRRQLAKASSMREAKAARSHDREAAILNAITTVRGDGPSAHPDAEAGRILVPVNKILGKKNHAPVSKDMIYRRLKKYPRS